MAMTHSISNSKPTFKVVKGAELKQKPPNTKWLIENLWSDSGVGVIGGSPKSCKTWLGLEMAVSVASGTPCLNHFFAPRKGPALIFLAEDCHSVLRDRLEALCAARHISLPSLDVNVITDPCLRLDSQDHLALLENTVSSYRPRLLLLDPFVRIHSVDENNAQEVASILDHLRQLQRKFDCAVIVVHHTRKASGKRPGQTLRGSGDIWAWGDSNIYLTRSKKGIRLTSEHRAAPSPDPLTLTLNESPVHLTISNPEAAPPALKQRIIDALSVSEHPLTRTKLREKLAVNNKRLGNAINSLIDAGLIKRSVLGLSL